MSVKNWNFSYSHEKKRTRKQNMLDTVSLWGAMGLLWYSFLSIIGEHFPEYLQVTVEVVDTTLMPNPSSVAPDPVYATYGLDWWVIGLFAFMLWVGYDWPKNYLKKWAIPCQIAAIGILAAYAVVNLERIVDGFIRLAWFYLPHFNYYYKSNLYMGLATANENAVVAFTVISMLFWGLSWVLAYGLKKRVLLVTFPLWALVLELTVGLSPQGSGMLYALLGAVLLATLGSASIVKKIVAVACVGISVLLSGALFGENIENLATKEQKQELLAWQNNFDLSDFNIFKLLQIDLHFNLEQLNNKTPNYTGKIVLEVETDERPITTVYLKGFYGTNYENGNWIYDDSVFQNACLQAGKSQTEVAKQIFQMPFEREKQIRDDESAFAEMLMEYRIVYTGTTGNVAYAPYLSDYNSMDDEYTLMGDYLLKKSVFDQKIEGIWYYPGSSVYSWEFVNIAIEKGFGNHEDRWDLYSEIDLTDQKEELEWMNGLADAYLQVPESAEFVSEIIAEIDKKIEADEAQMYDGIMYDEIMYGGTLLGDGDDSENGRRIKYAKEIEKYLEEHMWYSLDLDDLPNGADPIEYALTESHEGYCMHFASAATLLLREAGVPARYVSGYAIEPTAFKRETADEPFKAQVGDFMAHTWVEIYLDNIGWVHMEATPGSSLENLPSSDDISRWDSIAEAHRAEMNKQETESENSEQPSENTEEATETESEDTPQDTQNQNTESNTQTESEMQGTEGVGGNDDGQDKENSAQIWKALGIVGGLTVLVLLIVMGIRYGNSRYQAVLTREIEKNMTRKAVKRINRRLYRKLRLSTLEGVFWKKWTDIEYRSALIERFKDVSEAEWDRYMEIVKKNHYSKEKISIEEMQYCYECYTKAKLFNISLTKE